MRVLIIGGGLAGCALAYVLKRRGAEPVILEGAESLAAGASGNRTGLYNPRFTAELTPQAQFYSAAYFTALETFAVLEDVDWTPCGALHLVTDEKKARRFPKTVKSWNWPEEEMFLVAAQTVSEIAGIEIGHEALYLPRSGSVSPKKLCTAYAQGIEVHLKTQAGDLQDARAAYGAQVVIAANGMGALGFKECAGLPLNPVRGQITLVEATPGTEKLNCHICYGGYMSRSIGGMHVVGSSFQPWLDHSQIIDQDDRDNIEKLKTEVPAMEDVEFKTAGHRAAVRTASRDHFPVIGRLGEGVYISAAHGSHGILSTLQGAHILADMIMGAQGKDYAAQWAGSLSPERFL